MKYTNYTKIIFLFLASFFSIANSLAMEKDLEETWSFINAARAGNLERIKSATESGIDVNAADNGNTALIAASRSGNKAIVDYLLSQTNIAVNKKFKNGRSALLVAVANQQREIVSILLAHPNIDVNLQDNAGNTAVLIAIVNGFPAILNRLLRKPGLDLNLRNKKGDTALSMAQAIGNKKIIDILLTFSMTKEIVEDTKRIVTAINNPEFPKEMKNLIYQELINNYWPREDKLLSHDVKLKNINLHTFEFSPDGRFFVNANPQKDFTTIDLWDLETLKIIFSQRIPNLNNSIRFSSNGEYLIAKYTDPNELKDIIQLLELTDLNKLTFKKIDTNLSNVQIFHAAKNLFIAISRAGQAQLIDLTNLNDITPTEFKDELFNDIIFNRNQDILVSSDFELNLAIWDVKNPNNIKRKSIDSDIKHFILNDTGKLLLTLTHANELKLFDLSDFDNITPKEIDKGVIFAKFNPNGQSILIYKEDPEDYDYGEDHGGQKILKLINLKNDKSVEFEAGKISRKNKVIFNSLGNLLLTIPKHGKQIKLWNLSNIESVDLGESEELARDRDNEGIIGANSRFVYIMSSNDILKIFELKPWNFEQMALLAKLNHLKDTKFDLNLLFNDKFYLDILRSFPIWKQINIVEYFKLNPVLKPNAE